MRFKVKKTHFECGGFLLQLSLFIEMQPQKFVSERSKVAFLISLLSGQALLWAQAILNSQSSLINSFDAFSAHFKEVFGLSTGSLSLADQLIHLRQGTSSASDFAVPHPSGLLWMEQDSAANNINPRNYVYIYIYIYIYTLQDSKHDFFKLPIYFT